MKALLYAGGVFHLAFALFHLSFWKLFDWRNEFPRLGFVNRNIVRILNLCLTYVFFAVAWVSVAYSDALLQPGLGHALLAVVAGFWLLRAIEQVVCFGVRNIISGALFAAFLCSSALYAIPLLNGRAVW